MKYDKHSTDQSSENCVKHCAYTIDFSLPNHVTSVSLQIKKNILFVELTT